MKPTQEQTDIGNLVRAGNNVKIIAGAGTGKSSTLRYIATRKPASNFLAIMFNRANMLETLAHPDRPDNLFSSTQHSLTYRAMSASIPNFKERLKSGWFSYNDIPKEPLEDLICDMEMDGRITSDKNRHKALVLFRRSIINCTIAFCQSDKSDMTEFAKRWLYINLVKYPETDLEVNKFEVRRLTEHTVAYWNSLLHDHSTQLSHDFYVKMFQLEGKKIHEVYDTCSKQYVDVDVLCLDEAQDTNPVMEAIFANQTHLQRVIVGDPNQQLYRWRGAGEAMNHFKEFKLGYLSESFRFNQHIADLANIVLKQNKASFQLIGSGKDTEVVTQAVLTRKNETIVDYLFKLVLDEAENPTGIKVYTSLDLRGVFGKLFHLNDCYFNTRPKYPSKELSSIVDRETMEEAIRHVDEIKRLNDLRMMLTSHSTLMEAKKAIEALCTTDLHEATLALSTIHGSKGLEWHSVRLHEDFLPEPNEKKGETWETVLMRMDEDQDQLCMLYVAITRAKVEVELPFYINAWVNSKLTETFN